MPFVSFFHAEMDKRFDFLAAKLLQEGRHDVRVAPEELPRKEGALGEVGSWVVVSAELSESPAFESEGRIEGQEHPAGFVVAEALLVQVDAAIEARTAVHQSDVEAE